MPEPRELQLRCLHAAGDTLSFRHNLGGDALIVVDTAADGTLLSTYMDEHQARQLFNWLGILLHSN